MGLEGSCVTQEQTGGSDALLVTAQDAATMLGCSVRTLWRMAAAGVLTPVRIYGRTIRFRVDDLRKLAAGQGAAQ
jgi:excisionase family DNA binding protein